jgi:hypothetical protein
MEMHAFLVRLGFGIMGYRLTCTLTGCYSITRSPDFKLCLMFSGDRVLAAAIPIGSLLPNLRSIRAIMIYN